MEAIILAGGLGTRLNSVIFDIPKPMAPIGQVPFISYILKWIQGNGITKVILSVGYKWEIINEYFGDEYNGIPIIYSIEEEPLGTGGAIAKAMNWITTDNFFIINGDTFFNADLQELLSFHKQNQFDFSMLLKPMCDFDRYGTVELGSENRVVCFNEKKQCSKGLINGGVYVANKSIKDLFPAPDKFSFETDFLERSLKKLKIGGSISDGYFIDIGIPSDYEKAQNELLLLKI